MLNYIDPGNVLIHHRMYRDSCVMDGERAVKDLRVFYQWNLSEIIIVDNSITCFSHQLNNGIPLKTWINDESDDQLLLLITYLSQAKSC